MKSMHNDYPALSNFTYLNSCSSGLISNALLSYRRELDEAFQQNGSNFRAGVYKNIKDIKTTIADAFGAQAERTALVPSCSHGLNLVLEALAEGQKVLHLQNDYPSIIWPFESRNFTCTRVTIENYTQEELAQHIQDQQIDILAVSAVQYSNGEIIAPQTFRALKQQFPKLLILVDGTQFLGTAPFHFQESGIDLFAASAFKWLCAGYGNGVLFLSEELTAILHSKVRGYNTYKNPRMEGEPSPAELFEPGHQDLLAFKSLQFQVAELDTIGYDQIQAQIQRVKRYARKKITNKTSFEVITSVNPYLASGILSVDAPKALVQYLNQNQVVCSYNRGLRLGIHFYNTLADIDCLVELMSQFRD